MILSYYIIKKKRGFKNLFSFLEVQSTALRSHSVSKQCCSTHFLSFSTPIVSDTNRTVPCHIICQKFYTAFLRYAPHHSSSFPTRIWTSPINTAPILYGTSRNRSFPMRHMYLHFRAFPTRMGTSLMITAPNQCPTLPFYTLLLHLRSSLIPDVRYHSSPFHNRFD